MFSDKFGSGEAQLGRGEFEGEILRCLKLSMLLSELFEVKFDDALVSMLLGKEMAGKDLASATTVGVRSLKAGRITSFPTIEIIGVMYEFCLLKTSSTAYQSGITSQ